jgi:hypothetical protein
MATVPNIAGFRKTPKKTAGGIYKGRFTCQDVQWTGSASDIIATFTITADELADAVEGGLVWTDQDVQRGIQPTANPRPHRELSLAAGYPDPSKYVFDVENADNMVEKLLAGERIFFNPLVWNLRPGSFDAYWNEAAREIYLYAGKIYLPDSHHRQQAITKAVRISRDAHTDSYRFSGDRQFKVELYFLSREDEGNYFFDKNQRPKPVAKSKAYDLTTQDDLSLLAKRMIEKSVALHDNVNRVTDRLTARNPQVVTLSTLREMMRSFAPSEQLDTAELEGTAAVASEFYDLLAEIRSELGRLAPSERRRVRENLVVDSAVMMHGYAALMKDYNADLGKLGSGRAKQEWKRRLNKFSRERMYKFRSWKGDFFAKANPLWRGVGIVKPGKSPGSLTVLNTGAARSECGRVLRQLISTTSEQLDLEFLAKR